MLATLILKYDKKSFNVKNKRLQYKYCNGYIIRAHARSRKRLNPTLFPHLSHAKPMLNLHSVRAGVSCSVKTITLALASTLIKVNLMQAQVKMLKLSEHFEYKKCLHIFPNIHV